MRAVFSILIAGLVVFSTARAEDHVDLIKKGNAAFNEGDYKKALEYYHAAEPDLPESPELEYNLAGALAKDGAYEQAVDKFGKALNTGDMNLGAAAHYNLGNTYFWMDDYQNAIGSYEASLKINPNDMDAKFNLELARRMLKEQLKPQQQDQQDQQQQNQDQQEKEEQQQSQQDEDQQQEQQQQQPQPRDEKEISKEDAERILNALKDDELDVQKKIKHKARAKAYTGKDW